MYRDNLSWLRLGDQYTAWRPWGSLHPPSRGGVRWKVTQPSWTAHRYSALHVILQPGAVIWGKRGRVVVSRLQSALVLWRVHRTPPEKVHSLLVLKTNVPPRAKCLCTANDGVGAGGEQRKGRDTGRIQLPQLVQDRSWFQPRRMEPRWFAKRTFKRTHKTRFRCCIAWFTRCRKGGSSERVS